MAMCYAYAAFEECNCGESKCQPYSKISFCKDPKDHLDVLRKQRSPRKVKLSCLIRKDSGARALANEASRDHEDNWFKVEKEYDSISLLLNNLENKRDYLCLNFEESDGHCFYQIFKGAHLQEVLKSSSGIVCCQVQVEKLDDAKKAACAALQLSTEDEKKKCERERMEELIDMYLKACESFYIPRVCQAGDGGDDGDGDGDPPPPEEAPKKPCCVCLVSKEQCHYKVVKVGHPYNLPPELTLVQNIHVGSDNVDKAVRAAREALHFNPNSEWLLAEEDQNNIVRRFREAVLPFEVQH